VKVLLLIAVAVVMAVVSGPPQGTLLQRRGSDEGDDELKDPARFVRAVVWWPTLPEYHRCTENRRRRRTVVRRDHRGLAAHRPLARERQILTAKNAKIAKTIAKGIAWIELARQASRLFNYVE